MNERRARIREILLGVVHEARREKLTFVAGSIAYHAFLSILPLLLLVFAVVNQTQNVALGDSAVRLMQAVLTEDASAVIQQGLAESDASVSLLGVVFLVWGALRIFRGLDTAFSDIYETGRENTFADQLGDGLLLLVTVGLAIVAASLVGRYVTVTGDGWQAVILQGGLTSVGLFVVFYPMYYIFPDADVSVLEVVPGAAFAAVGVTVGQVLFATFKAGSPGGNLVASILLLLTWLYVVGLVILLGVAINAVLSNRSRDVDLDPVIGGVPKRGPTSDVATSRTALLAKLDEVVEALEDPGDSVTVVVDGERVALERPQTASIDRASAVFGMDNSVAITFRWWPDEE
ncbi:MAG: YihY/virulence factor BrkB family protein [Halobacteriales archaeon]